MGMIALGLNKTGTPTEIEESDDRSDSIPL